jgi:UDP-N-acetylmuramate--alanine ligase
LFEQFINSFSFADKVILVDIFSSSRETIDASVSSELLAKEMQRIHKDVLYISKFPSVIEYVRKNSFNKDFILLTMGAGDIYEIDKELIQ